MKTFIDQLGNEVVLNEIPRRIISLVPSQTELLFDLGLEENIIGITKFCIHPYHFKSVKTIIGGTKKVHYEKIKLLNPDLIIANKEENTLEIIEELKKIAPVWISDVKTLEDNTEMIHQFGQMLGCRTEAKNLIEKIDKSVFEFKNFIVEVPKRKIAYFIWKNPYMVAGSDTYINTLLELNKFENIYKNKEGRYPEVEIRKLRIEGDPDLVFLSSEPYPFKEEDAFEIGRFTHHAKTVYVDGEMFSWYGSRILKALSYFKTIHNRLGEE